MLPEINQISTETRISQNPFSAPISSPIKETNNVFQVFGESCFVRSNQQIIDGLEQFAKMNNSELIQESIKISPNGLVSFQIEQETPNKTGIEIASYTLDPTGKMTFSKKLLLEYADKDNNVNHYCFDADGKIVHTSINNDGQKKVDIKYSAEKLHELTQKRNETAGTLNLMTALKETTEDKTIKLMFENKENLLQKQLEDYDNFLATLPKTNEIPSFEFS